MTRWVCALTLASICAVPLGAADEVKKPIGTWTKKGTPSITFAIKADGLIATVKGDNTTEVFCDYGLSKDGVLFAASTRSRRTAAIRRKRAICSRSASRWRRIKWC